MAMAASLSGRVPPPRRVGSMVAADARARPPDAPVRRHASRSTASPSASRRGADVRLRRAQRRRQDDRHADRPRRARGRRRRGALARAARRRRDAPALRLHAGGARALPEDAGRATSSSTWRGCTAWAATRGARERPTRWLERARARRARRRPGRDAVARQPAARAARGRARARPRAARARRAVLAASIRSASTCWPACCASGSRRASPVVFSSHQLELVERLCDVRRDHQRRAAGRHRAGRRAARAGAARRRCASSVEGAPAGWVAAVPGVRVRRRRATATLERRARRRRRRPGRARRRARGRPRRRLRPVAADAGRAVPRGGRGDERAATRSRLVAPARVHRAGARALVPDLDARHAADPRRDHGRSRRARLGDDAAATVGLVGAGSADLGGGARAAARARRRAASHVVALPDRAAAGARARRRRRRRRRARRRARSSSTTSSPDDLGRLLQAVGSRARPPPR